MGQGIGIIFAETMIEENMIIVVYITIWVCVDMRIIWMWYMYDVCTHFLPAITVCINTMWCLKRLLPNLADVNLLWLPLVHVKSGQVIK